MMRIAFFILILLCGGLLLLQSIHSEPTPEQPAFLKVDHLALSHHSKATMEVQCLFIPTVSQLSKLDSDYSALWSHLNQLYQTNDLLGGKEYFSEAWFRNVCRNEKSTVPLLVTRNDLMHHLIIRNWAWDGLACSLTDSAAVFHYRFQDGAEKIEQMNIEMSLVFQGDNWRIDGMTISKFQNQNPIP
jgi:hypothetical protein